MIYEQIGKKKILEISIVINTIGENILNKVLESIVNSSVSVKEIIISIPSRERRRKLEWLVHSPTLSRRRCVRGRGDKH